jgi:4a-hydroxytetrahydrobiopterin dehydratase
MKWNSDKTLNKVFLFNSFKEALNFVNQVGDLAEKENHHPDIYLHDYKKVKISLFTHEKQAITALDHSLAKKIDNLLL